MTAALIDAHDAALFDLDGVVYLGPAPVEGAAEGIQALRDRGVRIGFVTNNAARTPRAVADHLNELGISATVADVVTSAQAGSQLLAGKVPPGSKVLVVGTEALTAEVRGVGLEPVTEAAADPVAVIQGYHPQLPWELVDEAAYAIQAGALWILTNTDATRPTDRGLVPGAGAQAKALACAVAVEPMVAGKPFRPLMEETVRRMSARAPLFVGDRIDTDIDGAAAVGMPSLFVFTGAHGKADLVRATNRPTHLAWDLRALLEPVRPVRDTLAVLEDGRWRLGPSTGNGLSPRDGQLDALRALLAQVEPGSDPDDPALAEALNSLDLLP